MSRLFSLNERSTFIWFSVTSSFQYAEVTVLSYLRYLLVTAVKTNAVSNFVGWKISISSIICAKSIHPHQHLVPVCNSVSFREGDETYD